MLKLPITAKEFLRLSNLIVSKSMVRYINAIDIAREALLECESPGSQDCPKTANVRQIQETNPGD
jgi:hypothetical protein